MTLDDDNDFNLKGFLTPRKKETLQEGEENFLFTLV